MWAWLRNELIYFAQASLAAGCTWVALIIAVLILNITGPDSSQFPFTIWSWVVLTAVWYPFVRIWGRARSKKDFLLVKEALSRGSIEADAEYYLLRRVAAGKEGPMFTALEIKLAQEMRSVYEPQR